MKATHSGWKAMGLEFDNEICVTKVDDRKTPPGISVGMRLTHVSDHRITSKSDGEKKLEPNAVMRFQHPDRMQARAALDIYKCPKENSSETEINYRYYGEINQKRAHSRHDEDGNEVNERTVTAILRDTKNIKEWSAEYRDKMQGFFYHSFISRHQGARFNEMVEKLPRGGIVVLADFSMNYTHTHQDSAQQEW